MPQHFPGLKLTGPIGLSNTLSWFGTGQGAGTERFLNHLNPMGGFFAADLETMVQNFDSIILHNAQSPDIIQFDNQKAWGNQPNPELAAQPTIKRTEDGPKEKHTLTHKFSPYFAEDVQTKWRAHLGDLADQDPGNYTGNLPTWASTIRLISELGIPSFKTGLTAMQLVNTLVFSKVVQMPSVVEMAKWIADNPSLRAVAGLKALGFHANTRDQIQGSYICFHNCLAKYLTANDRDTLGFHPPFTEHLLCKIPRWEKYLEAEHAPTLTQIAASMGIVNWTAGNDLTDARAIPFPMTATRDDLQAALRNDQRDSRSLCRVQVVERANR
ncbi:hypothetical protein FB451DRAFT_1338790 [Mycena latifolia]|nr:hypothetical protein FB451DRAFT_1338790 [Mycena latifolia]